MRAPAGRAGGYATDVNAAAIMAAAPPHRHATCHTVTVAITPHRRTQLAVYWPTRARSVAVATHLDVVVRQPRWRW